MSTIRVSLLAIASLGGLTFGSSSARDWPSVAAPPHAWLQTVAGDMTFNGLPMRIRQFHTARTPAEVLKFYKRRWNGRYVLNTLGPWQVLGHKQDGYYESIQVRPDGMGARGLIGATALEDISTDAAPGHGFARMDESRIINDIVSHDLGKTSRTLILTNRFSVSSNALFYRQHMKNEGWREGIGDGANSSAGRGRVLKFHRGNESAIVIIGRSNGRTTVVANLVRRGG
jgi:hypothetical protein